MDDIELILTGVLFAFAVVNIEECFVETHLRALAGLLLLATTAATLSLLRIDVMANAIHFLEADIGVLLGVNVIAKPHSSW